MDVPKRTRGNCCLLQAGGILPAMLLAAAALALASPSSATGAENKVLKLDGHGSYVELPQNLFHELTQATVEVWAKWDSFESYSRIFEFGAGWNSMSLFNHAVSPDLRFNLYSEFAKTDLSKQHTIRAPALLRTNEWIHLAAVSGAHGMKLYANGVLVGTNREPHSFAAFAMPQTNYLGRGLVRNPGDRDFHGEIDELRVWDHRRNTAQIRENMFKRLTGREPGLLHLWNFDDDTASDAASNAGHGRLKGRAEIVTGGPAFAGSPVTAAAPAAAPVAPAAPITTNISVAATVVAPSGSNAAAWGIAGAVFMLAAVLVWVVLMLRRSASAKLLPAAPAQPLLGGGAASNLPPSVEEEIKQRALAELSSFAKESLVQGLYSQRAALAEAQKRAQQELVELESRLAALKFPERIQAYQKRIAELERDLDSRSDELRDLTQATVNLLREKLAEEEKSAAQASRLN